jgi:hypothetical protein
VTRLRLRWSDPREDDPAIVAWPYPALLLATLFFNAAFYYLLGPEFPFRGHAVWYFAQVFGDAILLGALFYLGPALAAQAARRSLFDLAGASLGSIGAIALRIVCAAFLAVWLGEQLNLIVRWSVTLWSATQASPAVEGLAAVALAILLFWTGMQNLRALAKQAFFTSKLGLALLITALIRVREGWPAAFHAFDQQQWMVASPHLLRGLAQLSFWAAPLLFLAADFGQRCESRKQVNLIGLFGSVLPVAGSLVVLAFIERAGHSAGASTQGIVNIGSALFHGDSGRYYWKFLAVLAITMFGAFRFGVRALAECLAIFRGYRFLCWTLLALATCTIAIFASTLFLDLSTIVKPLARCLVAAAAVLSADFLTGRRVRTSARKIDWMGLAALLIGLALPGLPLLFIGPDPASWDPWLLRIYIVSFSTCLLGGLVSKAAA